MKTPNSLRIACQNPESLAERITKAPLRVIYDVDELRAHGYQDEGAIVPQLGESEPLTKTELAAIATDLSTPNAVRLVRVPQRTNAFMCALGRSGALFEGDLGTVTTSGLASFTQAPPGQVSTTVNPGIGKYVGMHIDIHPGQNLSQMMMGIACSEGARGLTFCPSITADVISQELRNAQTPKERLERREQIRRAAAQLQGEAACCYTLWLDGSDPEGDTYEAYANFQPLNTLHDGTSYGSTNPTAVQLMNTGTVTPASFESVI